MQEFLVAFGVFRGMASAVLKGNVSVADEVALFDSFMRGERTLEISGARAGSPAKAPPGLVVSPAAAPVASAPAAAAAPAPVCPVHGCAMVWREGVSKKSHKPYAFWSCPSKNADGSFCDEVSAQSGPK
jgi:hypothetical protein